MKLMSKHTNIIHKILEHTIIINKLTKDKEYEK